jgi:ABC-2 type transport system permease protein
LKFVCLSLQREMMFRTNFLVRCVTHLIWLGVMLVFLKVIFRHTQRIGDWDQYGLLFFMGTYLTLNATVNCFFINGCSRFSELIRTGNLDFELLRPVDEQFLLTCQRIDWALIPQVAFGIILSWYASLHVHAPLSCTRVCVYVLLLVAGVAILYSVLVALSAISVWAVRYQELYELWFYLLQFGNYPDDVYRGNVSGAGVRIVLTYVVPILLAINVPARFGAALLAGWQPVVLLGVGAMVTLVASRTFFKFALRSYQSASS